MNDNNIQHLLDEKLKNISNTVKKKEVIPPLKSDKNATLDNLIQMIAKVSSKVLKPYNAVFIPDEGAVLDDPKKNLESPTILYTVIERIPSNELKPRLMEEISKNSNDNNRRNGQIWTQRQSCIIQFDIIASDYNTANKVMTVFEDTIFSYTGYFKKKGVGEIYFKKHFTDKNLDKYRQWLSVRSIQYKVEIEKINVLFDTTIADIN